MDSREQTVYLIDATAQLFRAYFALPGLTSPEGLPTNAVYGFTTMLRKLLQEEQPPYVAAVFDVGGEVFRHRQYAEYKANRPPAPEDLNVQVPYAKQACEVLGVRVLEQAGYEADDVIATYVRVAREAGMRSVVVAADKDLMQLVGERVELLNPVKELRLDVAGVTEAFGVPPDRVRDVLGLMGDSIDNIPGVPGVGEKTALSLVSTYGGVEEILARAERFVALFDARDELVASLDRAASASSSPGAAAHSFLCALDHFLDVDSEPAERERLNGLREIVAATDLGRVGAEGPDRETAKRVRGLKRELKALDRGSSKRTWYAIRDHADQARMSKELATLRDDAPVSVGLETLRHEGTNETEAREFYAALGFRKLLAESAGAPGGEPTAAVPAENADYRVVTGPDDLRRVVDALREAEGGALVASGETPEPIASRLVGLALAWSEGVAAYVPCGGDGEGVSPSELREILGPCLATPDLRFAAHDVKRHIHLLENAGLAVASWSLDTQVAAFLLNPGRTGFGLDRLAEEYLGRKPRVASGTGARRGTASMLPPTPEELSQSAGTADVTLRLAGRLGDLLAEQGLRKLYDEVDGPLLPVLARMEARGIRIDTELLGRMSHSMEEALGAARAAIFEHAGTEFNVDSPKQLREVLFERLGLQPKRKTAKSKVPSTDAQTLEELAEEHAIARSILEYRELAKLKSTYVDALPRLVRPATGRVHTSFHPTGAATGRLSSSDPNLQNIPSRTEAGRQIRSAFVPESGHRFLSSDYSQVELRVLAHLTGDAELAEAFNAGEDIHRYTASRVFDVPVDQVTGTMRRRAKAVNFGILYGMSEFRLAREQGMERGEARRFIEAYFERFASVRGYIDDVREQARRDGAVRTMFGRVRFFPQLHQRVNRAVQEQALRAAVNTTIQGTAADLMKMAMLRVDEALRDGNLAARVLLQVHDELLLEVAESELDRVSRLVREAMENVHRLAVPLVVDQKSGVSWLEVT